MKKDPIGKKKTIFDGPSGCPYWFISDEEEVQEEVQKGQQIALPLVGSAPSPPSQSEASNAASARDPVQGLRSHCSGNPYARLASQVPDELASAREFFVGKKAASISVSKAAFVKSSRRILEQYIPAAERRHLRQHHKDFITRNAEKSPEIRARILSHLDKYDLSTIAGISAQFNRERDPFTEAKLREIESLAES